MRSLRNLLLAFGCGGGAVAPGDAGGGTLTLLGGGGVRGMLCGGIEEVDDGVDGVLDVPVELAAPATGLRGAGWFVAELAEPGRTTGRESVMLDLSA
jgi:hypothetical protein